MKKRWIILSVFLIFALSACASRSSQQAAEGPAAVAPAVEESKDAYMNQTAGSVGEQSAREAVERLVIKQAYMRVSVADPAAAMRSVMSMAEGMDGYVVSSNQWNSVDSSGKEYAQTSITIRVPSERLDEAMQKIRDLAADPKSGVLSESVNGQDVTSDYVDSQSRLRNLEAAEQQLVKLLESATDLQYTLDIFRELTNIRSEIEVLKGHIKYLEESSSLSSISVEFVAEASLQPIQVGPWKPSGEAKKAVQALIRTAQKVGTGLIWFAITWVPFLLPIGLIIFLIVRGSKKRKAARKAAAEKKE
ncbi:MAG: DUF4349 domain-containing protein [Anaerolineaceae bacterium]|nr:DUF4349 domain-containing protein [Anaerolineaceae bacterium]HQK04088.1 DUF4349 domain-containing protein [Anaerolineaceae bacterium]